MSLSSEKWKWKPPWDTTTYPLKWLKLRSLNIPSVDKNVEDKLSLQLTGMYIVTTTLANRFSVIYLRWNHIYPMIQQLDFWIYIWQKNVHLSKRHNGYVQTTLLSIALNQKQSSPKIEWINTLWHSQTSQHYATINSKVDDSHSIMLSERSQTQWNKHRYGEEGKG